jgi:hypothetical protein
MKIFLVMVAFAALGYYIFAVQMPKQTEEEQEKTRQRRTMADDVNDVTGYATGHTQIYAGQNAKAKVKKTSIQKGVTNFEAMEQRTPGSLSEMVREGYLSKADTKDEWNRPLKSEIKGQKLIIRSMGRDRKYNTSDDWFLEFPIKSARR